MSTSDMMEAWSRIAAAAVQGASTNSWSSEEVTTFAIRVADKMLDAYEERQKLIENHLAKS